MSILQPLRRIVGANQEQPPSEVKMTLVLNRYRVPLGSNSSALTEKNDSQIFSEMHDMSIPLFGILLSEFSRLYMISEFIDWGRSVRGNIKRLGVLSEIRKEIGFKICRRRSTFRVFPLKTIYTL